MAWLPDGENILNIRWLFLTESTNVTDTRTDTAWQHRPRLHSIARQQMWPATNDAIYCKSCPSPHSAVLPPGELTAWCQSHLPYFWKVSFCANVANWYTSTHWLTSKQMRLELSPHQLCGTLCHLTFSRHLRWLCFVNDWRRIYFRDHSLMSYSDDYVSVDLAITFCYSGHVKYFFWLNQSRTVITSEILCNDFLPDLAKRTDAIR